MKIGKLISSTLVDTPEKFERVITFHTIGLDLDSAILKSVKDGARVELEYVSLKEEETKEKAA